MIFKLPSPLKPFYNSMITILWFFSLIQFWAGYTLPSMGVKCRGSPVDWKSPWRIFLSSSDLFLAAGTLPALWEYCCQPGQAEPYFLLPPLASLLPLTTMAVAVESGWSLDAHSLDFLKPFDYGREDRGPSLILAMQVCAFSLSHLDLVLLH